MSLLNRLAKLEAATNSAEPKGYLCVIGNGIAGIKEDGFKVQPYGKEFGGTGREPFTLATRGELEAFAARPDVRLVIVEIMEADHDAEGAQAFTTAEEVEHDESD